ncbi:MAG: sulfotransferase domain-containing protein [Rubrobacter sp.]|nr:sulfotransferase domain-containing protein [Rubrobacter sp.]
MRSRKASKKARDDVGTGVLPDFLILGTEKGGTSTLYWTLCQHPLIEPATKKEVHFFDSRRWFEKDVRWYRSQFPALPPGDGRMAVTGEASPYYLLHPHTPRRAFITVPDAKLIALLRNPIDRAYSAYRHKLRRGQETLSFEEALEGEEERTVGELGRMLADETYRSRAYPLYSYQARGIYVDQLIRWHEHFDPDQLLVLKSEDYFTNPKGITERVHEFLGLPKSDVVIERRKKLPYQPMDPATRRRLEEYFEPHNRRLYDYLGVDFGW